jgi:hypothetical protein
LKGPKKSLEQRRFTRITLDAGVRLASGQRIWHATLVDICLKGLLVEVPAECPVGVGDLLRVQVRLGGGEVVIDMQCQVAHLDDGRAGLSCTGIDLDSFRELRRLLELNLGNEEQLLRELGELG